MLCSTSALAQSHDAPPAAPTGPSGDARPIDPYAGAPPANPAPAPSQQQAPAREPAPNTTPADARPQPPASEQKPLPPIDKPAPAPIDPPQPVPAPQPAQIAPPTPALDVANAPPQCRDAGLRASSTDRDAAPPAKISFAICTAQAAITGLQLVDAEQSVRDVDHATENAFGLLDEVATYGDPRWQIVALHAEGDLLAAQVRRMLDTVPPPGATPEAIALHDSRLQLLQAHLKPWIQRAQDAFVQVDQLARANPQLATRQPAAGAVADSRRRLTTGVATR